jgi:serine/threonine-protein kinase
VDPELPSWADTIVLRAMEKDPDARYQSAAEMRNDIQRALSGYPLAAPPMTSSYAGPIPGTRRMDPLGQTKLQGQTGGLPPYQYGQEETGARGGRGRRKVWPWVVAVLAIAVVAALILAYQLVSGTHHTSNATTTTVPHGLTGMKLLSAETTLHKAGLKWHAVSHKTPTGPYNKVTSTSPAAGAKVAKGSFVTLNYNVPPGATAIPDVTGKTVAQAMAILKHAGFKNVTANPTPIPNLRVGAGLVVRTDPPKGTTVKTSTPITLKVSGGGVAVPNVVGQSQSDAQNTLTNAGLFYRIITQQGPPGTPPGMVWKTTPKAGVAVLPHGSVTIYVSPQVSPTPSSSSPSPTTSPSPTGSPSP